MLITLFHRENSHPLWTIFRFGIVNLLGHLCCLHFEVLFLRSLPICYGACKDSHHGHNNWTLKHFESQKKQKKTERSGLVLTSSHSYKLQWWQPAGLFASCNTRQWEIKNRDWAFLRRKEHVQIPSKTTTNKGNVITESNVNVEVICVQKTNFVNDCMNPVILLKNKLTSVLSLTS